MSSRIINGNLGAEEIIRRYYESLGADDEPKPDKPPKPKNLEGFLEIKDIECVDADGHVFEHYPVLYVAKDIVRDPDGSQVNFTPYKGAVHFESKGLFMPSIALICNILAYLFRHKDDEEVRKVLYQYKDKGNGTGWHCQNTLVKWNNGFGEVIHYPQDNDFTNNGGTNQINKSRSRRLPFVVNNFGDVLLEEALKRIEFQKFVRQYTGLRDPSILVDIGKEFGKPTKVWVPNNPSKANYTASAWVGCDIIDFLINPYGYLNKYNAARGVREP